MQNKHPMSEFLNKDLIRKNFITDLGDGNVEIMDKTFYKRKNYSTSKYNFLNI